MLGSRYQRIRRLSITMHVTRTNLLSTRLPDHNYTIQLIIRDILMFINLEEGIIVTVGALTCTPVDRVGRISADNPYWNALRGVVGEQYRYFTLNSRLLRFRYQGRRVNRENIIGYRFYNIGMASFEDRFA